jgi:hypothetical protein
MRTVEDGSPRRPDGAMPMPEGSWEASAVSGAEIAMGTPLLARVHMNPAELAQYIADDTVIDLNTNNDASWYLLRLTFNIYQYQ